MSGFCCSDIAFRGRGFNKLKNAREMKLNILCYDVSANRVQSSSMMERYGINYMYISHGAYMGSRTIIKVQPAAFHSVDLNLYALFAVTLLLNSSLSIIIFIASFILIFVF